MNQSENPRDESNEEEHEQGGAAETPAEDPSQGPGPRGNQDIDPDRVGKTEEDLDRTGN